MMKKLFLAAIALLSIQMAFAQVVVGQRDYLPDNGKNTSKSKLDKVSTFACKFGVKAGADFSSISSKTGFEEGFKMGTGFRVGAVANLRWGQRTENSLPGTGLIGLQPEILFSMQNVGSNDGKITMQTVQLPIMLKIYPTTELNIEVGPEFSYIISTTPEEVNYGGTQIKCGQIKGLNVGVGAGLAYDFSMGLTIGARYTYNFINLAKNLDWKNNNIQVTVGWLF